MHHESRARREHFACGPLSRFLGVFTFLAAAVIGPPSLGADESDLMAYCGQIPPGLEPGIFAPGLISTTENREFGIAFSPTADEIYFTRKIGETQTIFRTAYHDGIWSAPKTLPELAGYDAMEPFMSADGTRLYFSWECPAPSTATDPFLLWVMERAAPGKPWSKPRVSGPGMYLSATRDGQAFVTDVMKRRIATAKLLDGLLGPQETVRGGVSKMAARFGESAHPAVAPDGSYLLFDIDWSHLFLCFREADGSWGEFIDLARHGIPESAGTAAVSPDGKYLFYRYNDDIWWVSTDAIKKIKVSLPRI